MTDPGTLAIGDAVALVARAFTANGVPGAAALSVARGLVAAEAEGQAGHGFSRIEDYVAQARSGKVRAGAEVTCRAVGPAAVIVDAGHGFAFPALDVAVAKVVEAARAFGIGYAGVTRSHHAGALSVQVERIADAGCVGLMMANTPAAIAAWGGKAPLFGTNPIAFAAPRAEGPPLVIDLSLSRVARGKVMHAKKSGAAIPEGWALDADGQPTTDPEAALGGSMLPIGGAKGVGLALMVETLAAVMTGASLSGEAASFFSAEGPPPGVGQILIAMAPPDAGAFSARMEVLLEAAVAEPGTRLPGDRRLEARARAEREGLRVPEVYLEAVRSLAGEGA